MITAIDKTKWSRSSQNSAGGHYDERATHYENISYRCKRCETPSIFTAEDQKVSYEERQDFVWRIPSLCAACENNLVNLRTKADKCQTTWNSQKSTLNKDRLFLEEWLSLLQEIEKHGRKGSNPSVQTMLLKLLRKLP